MFALTSWLTLRVSFLDFVSYIFVLSVNKLSTVVLGACILEAEVLDSMFRFMVTLATEHTSMSCAGWLNVAWTRTYFL